ncbi:hypothetical protein ACFL4X_01770 [Gemmatimonadota bacterium]
MAFSWGMYILLADELTKKGGQHRFRTAISRAYYGAFGQTRDLMEIHGYKVSTPDVHRKFRNQIIDIGKIIDTRESRILTLKLAGDLKRIWYDRCIADYDGNLEVKKDQAEKAWLTAKGIASKLEDYENQILKVKS